jgi:hypothetical protein
MKFELGQVLATPAALHDFGLSLIAELLVRHASGDWGDLCAVDRQQNSWALRHGGRLLSAFETPTGRVWIITESDRSSTCVLQPEDY